MSGIDMGKLVSFLNEKTDLHAFYRRFLSWSQKSSRVNFSVGGDFVPLFAAGVTEAFNHFYLQNAGKPLFLLKGEYPYHRDVFDSLERPYHWYGEEKMETGAFLILSSPFSGTGNYAPEVLEILRECMEKKVDVMLDFAFVGLGESMDLAELTSFPCVKLCAFSFSKMFGIGKFRAGICWMRPPCGPLEVVNSWNYINGPAVYVASRLMEHFSFDYMSEKYAPLQREICLAHGLKPSASYLFGLGGEEFHPFSRDGVSNRVCLSPAFDQRSL